MTSANASALAHTRESFSFTANGPMSEVAPLFGAEREKEWARGWEPRFVWPTPAVDREGMVFTVAHGDRTAVWVNTRFDLEKGDVQYVYVIPEVMTTRITLKISRDGERTRVKVDYERTALSAGAARLVREMAEHDATAGEEWRTEIDAAHAKRSAGSARRS